ncbi:MAG TPA: TolC family protein [Desulfobacteraceae bacterium]|nr:TolC family protein [Desulfobacteraceae bacterium]
MKKRILILFNFIIPCALELTGQKVITLKDCYELAMTASPIAPELEAWSQISAVKDKNLARGWLPALDAGGSFVYNSSVTDLTDVLGNVPVPGFADLIDPLPHEQYRITMDISQVIYDGGAIKGARALEKTGLNIHEKEVETDLYKLRGQINGYYFNLLLLDRQKELLQSYHELIVKRIASMNSALAGGVILKSDMDALAAEKIILEQQIRENEIRKASLLRLLSGLTGIAIDESAEFILPSPGETLSGELSRPELQIFDLRKKQLDASLLFIQSRRMPRAGVFATLGYGNPPGSNFFRDEFAPYYVLGASIKWNIYDWNRAKNEKQVISLQQYIIDNRKSELTDNLNRLLEAKSAEISNLGSLLESDAELIALRKRITASAESRYENGTITATEYLNEMTAEREALINYEIHKINLVMAKVEYLNISGQDIE